MDAVQLDFFMAVVCCVWFVSLFCKANLVLFFVWLVGFLGLFFFFLGGGSCPAVLHGCWSHNLSSVKLCGC